MKEVQNWNGQTLELLVHVSNEVQSIHRGGTVFLCLGKGELPCCFNCRKKGHMCSGCEEHKKTAREEGKKATLQETETQKGKQKEE